MTDKFFLLLFCILAGTVSAQPDQCDPRTADEEQKQLEFCYHYSNIFGYDIEAIKNPKLYKAISEWLGTGYCYAGDSKSGVDCSGFVSALYKHVFNISLDGSSNDIYGQIRQLKKSQLREGDLVFFRIRKKRVSHVGIYLGQNKFAHASLSEGVVINDLNESYYLKYFYKGGRIVSPE